VFSKYVEASADAGKENFAAATENLLNHLSLLKSLLDRIIAVVKKALQVSCCPFDTPKSWPGIIFRFVRYRTGSRSPPECFVWQCGGGEADIGERRSKSRRGEVACHPQTSH